MRNHMRKQENERKEIVGLHHIGIYAIGVQESIKHIKGLGCIRVLPGVRLIINSITNRQVKARCQAAAERRR